MTTAYHLTATPIIFAALAGFVVIPEREYRAPFEPEKIGCVESVVRSVSGASGFLVDERDREQMKFVTNGIEAFSMTVYSEKVALDDEILNITNGGIGKFLGMQVVANQHLGPAAVNEFVDAILEGIRDRCEIVLQIK